jgi:hypothetical protein
VVFGDDLDAADDAGVELGQVLGRDPVLDYGAPADLVDSRCPDWANG